MERLSDPDANGDIIGSSGHIYVVNIYEDSANLIWMALLILLSWPVLLTARFALLGMSDAKTVLVIDSIATPLKFVSAYILVSLTGSAGILASIMIFNIFLAIVGIYLATRVHGFFSMSNKKSLLLLRGGLANIPVILSRTMIFTLTVVLLASFGVDNAQIGTFYIALMISLFAGALVSSNAYMVIPHSSASKSDLSLVGARVCPQFDGTDCFDFDCRHLNSYFLSLENNM